MVIGPNGQLYGTAWQGGTKYGGTFWELVPSGSIYTEQVLWNFTGGVDGGDPEGDLITDSQHRIYGTTYVGGTSEVGTVYRFTP